MNNIFQTLLYQREKQKDTVLATIVWDDGSAPRGAGSQMLWTPCMTSSSPVTVSWAWPAAAM